jgi:dihydrofolate reductase
MSRVVVTEHVTLDGVMQAPGRPDEDTRNGFVRGGWGVGRDDEVMMGAMARDMARPGRLLLGRRTYEDLHGFWPHQGDNPFTKVLDEREKLVASRTLAEPLPWRNSTLLAGDAADAIAALREQPGDDIGVIGSGELVRSLAARGLVDEYVLLIHPLVLGSGRRLFDGELPRTPLRLTESLTTTTGVLIGRYEPEPRSR